MSAKSHSPRAGRRQLRQIQKQRQQGKKSRAARSARRLLASWPRQPGAWYELARWAETQGQQSQAIQYYRQVLQIQPRQADAWYRLGLMYEQTAQTPQAAQAFSHYLKLRPQNVPPHLYAYLAENLSRIQKKALAVPFYLKALEAGTQDLKLYFGLFEALEAQGDLDSALDCLILIGQLNPAHLGLVSLMMAYLLERKGKYQAADLCYAEATRREPYQLLWRLKQLMAYPIIAQSRTSIEAYHAQMTAALEKSLLQLEQQPLRVNQETLFYLGMMHHNITYTAYHHLDQKHLRVLWAQFTRRLLKPVPPMPARPAHTGRIHLGIIMSPKSVGLSYVCTGAMAEKMDPERFQVTVFCCGPEVHQLFNPQSQFYFTNPDVRAVLISENVYEAVHELRSAELDVAFFAEPAWDFRQYILAHFRVAPVQCTSWMNPGTTGIENLDYFLSCSHMEPPNAQANYTEKLVLWPTYPSLAPMIQFPDHPTRADFGLEADWHVYACMQNVLKFHPDFDAILAGILRGDPLGHLVVVSPEDQHLVEQLSKRFQQSMPDVMDRIWFFPALNNAQFLNLIQVSDVALDTLYYGGATTTYQFLTWGLPLVSLPTPRMTGCITQGLCRIVDYSEGLVDSPEAYVAKALEFGNQPDLRQKIQLELRAKAHRILQDMEVVASLERFLLRAMGYDPSPHD